MSGFILGFPYLGKLAAPEFEAACSFVDVGI